MNIALQRRYGRNFIDVISCEGFSSTFVDDFTSINESLFILGLYFKLVAKTTSKKCLQM